jgi:hypothetical protein
MHTKCFKIKLDIGIAGYVRADHYVASGGLLQFYASDDDGGRPVAVYALASVSGVEECQTESSYGSDPMAMFRIAPA